MSHKVGPYQLKVGADRREISAVITYPNAPMYGFFIYIYHEFKQHVGKITPPKTNMSPKKGLFQ